MKLEESPFYRDSLSETFVLEGQQLYEITW